MADGASTADGWWCPVCLITVGDAIHCPRCGLPQAGPLPARLRVIAARLHEISVEQGALLSESTTLGDERTELLSSLRAEPDLRPPPPSERSGTAGASGLAEWRPERVRDALLWLGAALLALSAITFSIVAWARLGAAGRAGLLFGATAIAGAVAIGLRDRLRATAEALTGLTLALALVDWYVVRRSGLGDGLDVATWWAIGTALVAGVAVVGAVQLKLRSAQLGAALLALAAGAFTVRATTEASWTAAVMSTMIASLAVTGAIAAARRVDWSAAASVLIVGSVGFEVAALGLALSAVETIDTSTETWWAALSILSLGVAPAIAVARAGLLGRSPVVHDLLAGLCSASVLGAALVVLSPDVGATGLAALAAGLGVAAVAFGRAAPRSLRSGAAGAGAATIGIAVLAMSPRLTLAVIGPLSWLSDPWSGTLNASAAHHFGPANARSLSAGWATVMVLLALVAAAAIATSRPSWRAPLMPRVVAGIVVSAALPATLAVALPAAGLSIGAVLLVELLVAVAVAGFAVALERDRPGLEPWLLAAAAVLAVPVAGWSAVDRGGNIAVLGVVIVAAGLMGIASRVARFRITLLSVAAAAALAETGLTIVAVTGSIGAAGFAVTVMGGAVLVLGALGRRASPEGSALELVGVLGILSGAAAATGSTEWLAASLTAATAALGVAALRPQGAGYARAAAVVAVAAIWAWLAAADVTILEAYTLPAAAVLLGAGILRRRADHEVGSWAAYGPGLALALGPSLLVALDRGGIARPAGVIVGAVACVLVGSHRRLRAPLMLGALALLALAVDGLGPVAAQAPRWVVLAVIGLLMLWLGASAERRLNQLRRWRDSLHQLC